MMLIRQHTAWHCEAAPFIQCYTHWQLAITHTRARMSGQVTFPAFNSATLNLNERFLPIKITIFHWLKVLIKNIKTNFHWLKSFHLKILFSKLVRSVDTGSVTFRLRVRCGLPSCPRNSCSEAVAFGNLCRYVKRRAQITRGKHT